MEKGLLIGQHAPKRLIFSLFLILSLSMPIPSRSSAENSSHIVEDQALTNNLFSRIEAHRRISDESAGYPVSFSLSEKIKEAEELASEYVKIFEENLTQLSASKQELRRLQQIPAHKKTNAERLLEKKLRENSIPSLILLQSLYAEKTTVFALHKPSGALIEVQFQEPLDEKLVQKKTPREQARVLGFPTYTPHCAVTRHGGNGHGMNLLVLCHDPKIGFQVLPVLALAHFHLNQKPKIKDIQHVYVPYSPSIHTAEIVAEGRTYWRTVVEIAHAKLQEKQIASRAYPGHFVHEKYSAEFVKNLLINEHMDHGQFNEAARTDFSRPSPAIHLHPMKVLVEKFFVVLGTNKERAYVFSLSKNRNQNLRAYGLAQFIKGTYGDILKRYPEAALEKDFYKGMRDHANAVQAMILLFDRDLSFFSEKARRVCSVSTELLEDCLAVAYNGGTGRLNGVVETYGKDWDEQKSVKRGRKLLKRGLTEETDTYIEKLRAIRAFEKLLKSKASR